MTLLLLLGGSGSGTVAPLVTGRQNYVVFDFRDKRPEYEFRNKAPRFSFRDKRDELEFRDKRLKQSFRDKRAKYE